MARFPTIRAMLRQLGGAGAWLRFRLAETASQRPPRSIASEVPYGLDRSWRVRAFRDHLVSLIRVHTFPAGLMWFAALMLVAVVWSRPADAQTTYAQAMAQCQAANPGSNAGFERGPCVDNPGGIWPGYIGYVYWTLDATGAHSGGPYQVANWPYVGPATPSNPCSSQQPMTMQWAGQNLAGNKWCKRGIPTGDGSTTSCAMVFQPLSPPVKNQWGNWNTYGTYSASGDTCDGTGPPVTKPDGTVPNPTPADPAVSPPPAVPAKTCGGGSCYDSANDQYCAVAGGSQVCVPGSTARSSGGGCSTSGDSTLCAGSPAAPKPPAAQVPDPATQVNSADKYTQADPTTGALQTVSTSTYNSTPGTQPSSGQTGSDTGPVKTGSGDPASGSSSAGSGSYGGGTDCNTPPVCSGDAVACGIGRQSWAQQCQIHSDIKSLTDPTGLDSLDHSMGPDDSPNDVFSDEQGDTSGNPIDGLDSSGFLGGGGQCPAHPIELMGKPLVDFTPMCDAIALFRLAALAFAYVVGAIIIGRSKA